MYEYTHILYVELRLSSIPLGTLTLQLLCVICNTNSFHCLLYKLCIHTNLIKILWQLCVFGEGVSLNWHRLPYSLIDMSKLVQSVHLYFGDEGSGQILGLKCHYTQVIIQMLNAPMKHYITSNLESFCLCFFLFVWQCFKEHVYIYQNTLAHCIISWHLYALF